MWKSRKFQVRGHGTATYSSILLHSQVLLTNIPTPPTLDTDYRWYVIIKCIIIKQVMEKSQLNVGSHQHAQWQLVSITHC